MASMFSASAVVSAEAQAQYETGAPPTTVTLAPQPAVAPEPQSREGVWYGWQTLLTDVGVITGLYFAGRFERPTLTYLSIGVYALAPPLIHFANERPESAGMSFAMRSGLPLVLGTLMASAASCDSQEDGESHGCSRVWFALGGALGAITASVLDFSVLGWKPAQDPALQQGAILTPSVWVDSKGARLTLSARF